MEALARLPVSTLCDVDKSLPVVDPAIRPLTFTTRIFGPAYTVVAAGEFLSVLYAIGEAAPGDVLVIQAGGAPLAALGELLATEAWQRGLGGIVVDGYVRDRDRAAAGPAAVGARDGADGGPQRRGAAGRRRGRVRRRAGHAGPPRARRRRRDRDRAARAARGVRGARRGRSSASRRRCSASVRVGDVADRHDEPARARRARCGAGERELAGAITPPS